MKILIATDHAGLTYKELLVPFLKELGHTVEDKGAFEYNETDDYPDFIAPLAQEISKDPDLRGIILGGTGQGEAVTANRFKGVRAAVFYGEGKCLVEDDNEHNKSIVRLTREHNNSNVLSIGARFVTEEVLKKAIKEWLDTPFSEKDRHKRRIEKMDHAND